MLDIPAEVSSHTSELIALRRHFHEHPELSLMETETMAYIQDTLRSYGIESSHIPNAGILAVITGKGPGRYRRPAHRGKRNEPFPAAGNPFDCKRCYARLRP